jgi:hypothetical protein
MILPASVSSRFSYQISADFDEISPFRYNSCPGDAGAIARRHGELVSPIRCCFRFSRRTSVYHPKKRLQHKREEEDLCVPSWSTTGCPFWKFTTISEK